MHNAENYTIIETVSVEATMTFIGDANIRGLDAMVIPYTNGDVIEWLASTVAIINALASTFSLFYKSTFWINMEFYPACILPLYQQILSRLLL